MVKLAKRGRRPWAGGWMGEFKAAVLAVAGLALSLLFAVIAFRVITPSILEAHFEGGTLVATLVALGLAAAAAAFVIA